MAKKQTRRPTTVPSEFAVRNPGANKGRNAKPGFIDLPDADDIWDQINFWSGRQDHLLQPETIAARDVAKTVTKGGAQAIDAYYTGGMAGSLYNNVLRPSTDINSSTNANWGAFGRDVAVAAGTAGAAAAVVKGGRMAAQNPTLQHYGNRVLNAIKGEQVILHSSPVRGMKNIQPFKGSGALPSEQVVFGWDSRPHSFDDWQMYKTEFSNDPAYLAGVHGFDKKQLSRMYGGNLADFEIEAAKAAARPGSTYVATVPKKGAMVSPRVAPRGSEVAPTLIPSGSIASTNPARVKTEIPLTWQNYEYFSGSRSPESVRAYNILRDRLMDQTYRAGGRVNFYEFPNTPKSTAQNVREKIQENAGKVATKLKPKPKTPKGPKIIPLTRDDIFT